MKYIQEKTEVKNSEKEKGILNDINKKIDIPNKTNVNNNGNNSNKEEERNSYNKNNKINYFNTSSKIGQNKVINNSSQKKVCINISETKNNLENKNINRINNIDEVKKENIKRTELFKPKPKNKCIQKIYSNTTNTNTNNTNSTNKKSSNNNNSFNQNNNNNKQNENKDDKVFIDSNPNETNSYSNQKEILYESEEIEQLNNQLFNPKNQKINNKRNKSIKKGELHTLDTLKSYNKNSELDYQTYTLPFQKDMIKVNIVQNNEKENKNHKHVKTKYNKNSNSSTNLKTYLKNNNNLHINTDFKQKKKDKHSFSNANSEKNLKLQANNNIRLSTNNIAKSTKNTLNINIYLPGYNYKKKLIKKKNGKSLNNIKPPKEKVQISTNRSLDLKHKNQYLISSRVSTYRKSNENNINISNNNINMDLDSERKIKNEKNFGNNSIIIPQYKLKLEAIKSRIYKLLNIYSLIALQSINNNNNDSNKVKANDNNKEENDS